MSDMRYRNRAGIAGLLGAALCASLWLAAPAMAQVSERRIQGLQLSGDEPIQIESDQLQINENSAQANFTGNVKVVQGDTVLKAGAMTVHYGKNGGSVSAGGADIEKIDVDRKVLLQSGTQTATADAGTFDMRSEVLVLTGKEVVLTEGDNVFIGCKLTVEMKTGIARLDSCGKRVMIQLDPKSRPNP